MNITPLTIPDLDYGYTQQYVAQAQKDECRLPAGKELFIAPRMNFQPSVWLNAGVNGFCLNGGMEPGDLGDSVPFSARGTCQGVDAYRNGTGNTYFENLRADQIPALVNSIYAKPFRVLTWQGDEYYDKGTGTVYDKNPAMWIEWNKQMGAKAAQLGRVWAGTYAGVLNDHNPEEYRPALASNAEALAWIKINGNNGQNPLFRENLVNQGCSPIINAYYRGGTNMHKRKGILYGQIEVVSMAMKGAGSNLPIVFFTEGVDNEVSVGSPSGIGYTARYRRYLPKGGFVDGWGWPTMPFGYTLAEQFVATVRCGIRFQFAPAVSYGSDPNVITPDYNRDYDNFPLFKYDSNESKNVPERAKVGTFPTAPDEKNGYPKVPLGPEDAYPIASKWYKEVYNFLGHGNLSWSKAKPHDVTDYGSITNAVISDHYTQKLPYVLMGESGNRRVVFLDDATKGAGLWSNWDLDINAAQPLVRSSCGGVPQCLLIEL